MPRLSIDYQKTVIYKIVCNDLTVTYIYVGMTTDFTNRKYNHKSDCNNITDKHYNFKIYDIIRANGGCIHVTNQCSAGCQRRLQSFAKENDQGT